MNYWVIAVDGNKYGPADLNTLMQWAKENRLQPDTELEVIETGQRLRARDVAGLPFAQPAAPSPIVQPAQPQQPANPYVPQDPLAPQQPANPYAPQDPLAQPRPHGQDPYPRQDSGQVYNPYQSPYPHAGRTQYGGDDGSKDVTMAYVWAAVGFLFSGCCIPLFAFIPAFISANAAITKGNSGGSTAKTVVIVLLVLALLGGLATFASVLLPIFASGM